MFIVMVFGRRERRGAGLPSKPFYKTKQILFQRILKWEKSGNSHQAEGAETAGGWARDGCGLRLAAFIHSEVSLANVLNSVPPGPVPRSA